MIITNPTCNYEWALAIFTARESTETLRRTIESAIGACGDRRSIIDVLVNGNLDLANQIARVISGLSLEIGPSIRVWHLPVPDKAETWNQYIHELWPVADFTFFIDGYVAVEPNALREVSVRLAGDPVANCATGVPSGGFFAARLRKKMIREHGIHGNLYALPHDVVLQLKLLPFRLPQGLYRTDPTMAAALKFSLDPANNDWTPTKVLVVPEAKWQLPQVSWWTGAKIKAQWKRKIRQAQGDFENMAVSQHLAIDRRSPSQFPATVQELVDNWTTAHPDAAARMTRGSWWHQMALKNLSQMKTWNSVEHPAQMLDSFNPYNSTN